MKITIEFAHDQVEPEQRRKIEALANNAFARVNSNIDKVHITLKDLMGPKGHPCKECTVTIEGMQGSSVFVKDVQENTTSAVKLSIDRALYAFMRKRTRAQMIHRRRRKAIAMVPPLPDHAKTYAKDNANDDTNVENRSDKPIKVGKSS